MWNLAIAGKTASESELTVVQEKLQLYRRSHDLSEVLLGGCEQGNWRKGGPHRRGQEGRGGIEALKQLAEFWERTREPWCLAPNNMLSLAHAITPPRWLRDFAPRAYQTTVWSSIN